MWREGKERAGVGEDMVGGELAPRGMTRPRASGTLLSRPFLLGHRTGFMLDL